MRRNIVHPGASELTYEIRGITELAHEIHRISGQPIFWENIGDPVQKGEIVPDWIKDIVVDKVRDNASFAYCPTRGVKSTREFLAATVNQRGKVQITEDDILFFNGLGDGIHKVYTMLAPQARVIGPSPSYSTHSSAEAAHAGSNPIVYHLKHDDNWMPDLDELRNKVKYNENIAGVMIINPDNPTGAVYPPSVIKEMVAIAREFNLFIVADEIYQNLVYDGQDYLPVSDLVEDVPTISLKGISKEVPWPGARCGWMEVYNQDQNPMFARYIRSIVDAKMLEVCSTTLPQMIIPSVYGHPNYAAYGKARRTFFAKRAHRATEILGACNGVVVNEPRGAFYLSVVFNQELSDRMNLRIEDRKMAEFLHQRCPPGISIDRKFCYQLLGQKQICVVPLSGFVCDLPGFRVTLLERDDAKFEKVFASIAESVNEFVASA